MEAGWFTINCGPVVREAGAGADRPVAARRIESRAVDQVDHVAPDVGVRLVQGTRLPLVDQVVCVLRVGVTPLVGDRVVTGDARAVVRRDAVPVRVGAADTRVVVHRLHLGARVVVGIDAERVEEEVVRMPTEIDDVLLVLVQVAREGIALLPHLIGRVEVLLEDPSEEIAVHARVAVHDLPGIRVNEHEFTHVGAVRHLDLVDELVRARHVAHEAHPVDLERRRSGPETRRRCRRGRVGVLLRSWWVRHDVGDRLLRGLRRGEPRVGVQVDVRHERAVHRRQLVAPVEVRAEQSTEDGKSLVLLLVRDVRPAVRILLGGHLAELGSRVGDPEEGRIPREEPACLAGRRGAGVPREEVPSFVDPGEADVAGTAVDAHGDGADRVLSKTPDRVLTDAARSVRSRLPAGRQTAAHHQRDHDAERQAHDAQSRGPLHPVPLSCRRL